MVETVRHNGKVSLEYMKVCEREMMIREQGEKTGIKIVEKRGIKIGDEQGEIRGNVKILRSMKKTMNAEQVAEVTSLDKPYVKKIFSLLEKYPKESDKQIALRLLSKKIKDKSADLVGTME